jgi:hypothetical protein
MSAGDVLNLVSAAESSGTQTSPPNTKSVCSRDRSSVNCPFGSSCSRPCVGLRKTAFFSASDTFDRLRESADYFDFVFNAEAALAALKAAMSGLAQPRRLRLLISGDGSARVEHGPLVQQPMPLKVAIAPEPVDLQVIVQGRRITPPVRCGLLAGPFRAELLARAEIQEGVVTLDDLRSASRLWLINSVHEWREALLMNQCPAWAAP